MHNRRREPPSVSSVTQHVLQGTLDTQVQADLTYVGDGHIKFHLGPVFLVLKGREAVLSMRELIDRLAPVIDEMYPDLDAELQRQRREIMRRATLDATGELPTPADIRAFLADKRSDKRERKIDELLNRPGYAALWTLKFCDILNANDYGVYADGMSQEQDAPRFQQWVRARLEENTPYDELAGPATYERDVSATRTIRGIARMGQDTKCSRDWC